MRGRILQPYIVEIAQLDAQLSDQTYPGTDPVFREPRVGIDPNTNERVLGRKERIVRLPAQVETGNYGQLVVLANGIAPKSALKLIFHYREFEERGMVDDQRRNTPIRVTDRLVSISNRETAQVLIAFPFPPGVFCTEASPEGLMGGRVNLLVCTFGDRAQGRPQGV